MAVPFSNTTVRVPHGFANLLEGLSREVLRRQPEDIPTFAAQYFAELLQKREASGGDPEKCCASMEQSFSKDDTASDAVNQETCSPVEETSSSENDSTVSQKDSCENIEDIITQPTQNSSPSPETLDIFNDIVEPPDSQANNELNESEEESGETDSELSYRGTADVDMRAERLKNTETDEEEMFENIQESDSVDEAAEKDLDPVTLISYHGLADIDVCAEELQSTSQEEKQEEGSGDVTVTDACFIPPSESPDPVLVEQGVLDSHDEFTRSETETSLYVDQDVDKEINDISYNEKTLASPVNEDKREENCDLSENVSEMTNTLSDDTGPEIHHVDQLHLNEEAESTSVSEVKTLDETCTDEMPLGVEIQQANDILAAEATSESSFILEKVSLEDRSHNNSPGLENLVNVSSEVQEENNNRESVTDLTAATDERDSQIDIQEDEIYDDKQGDPQDIPEMSPVGDMEGFVDSNLNPTGIPSKDMNKDDARTSQQDEIEAEDISEVDEGNNSLNAPEAQEDNLFYSTFTHHSKSTLSVPTSDETERDMKVNYKLSATPSQEHTEEPEPAVDYKESEQLEEKVHEPIVESENKDLDQQLKNNKQSLVRSARSNLLSSTFLVSQCSKEDLLVSMDCHCTEESSQPQEEEDIMDIPLDDPEANKAAAKIQAGFRGHMTRKKLKPGDKPGEEVSSTGETLNGSQGDAAGGSEGVETDETSVPEQ